MKIEIIKKNDDGTVVVKADDVSKLEGAAAQLTDKFNEGYAKGRQKGKTEGLTEIANKFGALGLEIDPENLDASIRSAQQKLNDLKSGKNKTDDLAQELQKKQEAFDKLKTEYDQFKRGALIDGQIKSLAQKTGAMDAEEVALIFKNQFTVDLDEQNNIVVKNAQGNQIFNEKGDPRPLDDVFENLFVKNKPHLFKAEDPGGSGGGSGDGPPSGTKLSDFKSDAEKAKFIQEHGVEAYQNLLKQHVESQNQE
ncbi:MAG TPA: hypothetical protein ENJ93_09980 [Chloroflexi bacterium]|nr:hypothetical protein [Chloroflexota bacterium]